VVDQVVIGIGSVAVLLGLWAIAMCRSDWFFYTWCRVVLREDFWPKNRAERREQREMWQQICEERQDKQ
jgi:hypothetical protein